MLGRPPVYRSFVVTLWQEHRRGADEPAVWRFRLEDPRTGRRRGFADLAALVAVLEDEMAAAEEGGVTPRWGPGQATERE